MRRPEVGQVSRLLLSIAGRVSSTGQYSYEKRLCPTILDGSRIESTERASSPTAHVLVLARASSPRNARTPRSTHRHAPTGEPTLEPTRQQLLGDNERAQRNTTHDYNRGFTAPTPAEAHERAQKHAHTRTHTRTQRRRARSGRKSILFFFFLQTGGRLEGHARHSDPS